MRPLIGVLAGVCATVASVGCTRDGDLGAGATVASSVSTLPSTTAPPTTLPTTSAPTSAPATPAPTTVPATPPPTPPPTSPATTPAPTGPPVTTVPPVVAAPDGTEWLLGPQAGDPQVTAPAADCEPFFAATTGGPYTVSECGTWNAIGGVRVWSVVRGASNVLIAVVWQAAEPDVWAPRARLFEPEVGLWSGVTIRTANVDAGPNDELLSGIRINGTGGYLTLDLLDIRASDPAVVARVPDIPKGVATIRAGSGIEIWGALFEPDDAGCCPSGYAQRLLTAGAGGWVLEEGMVADAATAPLPPTDF